MLDFSWLQSLLLGREQEFIWLFIQVPLQSLTNDTGILVSPLLPSMPPPLSYASVSVSNIHTFMYVHTHIYMKIFHWVRCLDVVITGKRNSLCNGCLRALQRIYSYPESSLLRAKSDHEERKPHSLWPQIIISVLHTWISSPLDWCLGWSQPEARASNKGPKLCCDSDSEWSSKPFCMSLSVVQNLAKINKQLQMQSIIRPGWSLN